MQSEEYNYKGKRMVRVNKKVARNLYNAGETVWLIPDMMRLDNAWQSPCPISRKTSDDFDTIINEFKYYNCDNERGKGVKYFVDKLDCSNIFKK